MKKIFATFAIAGTLLTTGCATVAPMSPTTAMSSVDTTKNSYALMTVTLRNAYHTSYQPSPIVVHMERGAADSRSDRLNFKFDDQATTTSDAGNHYFVRLPLAPGKYVMRGITGQSGIFPFHGMFFTPLHETVEIKPNSIVYLGHIDATVVERKDGELRAGPVIPLIDQAATGFSGGTWDISVSDQFDHDVTEFKKDFPALSNASIERDILPAWDKQKATEWWANH
ncbi:hypothetical protein [Paraburkholderia phenoliruptrix]|uniref:Lipoprotein n=1 Tax=Paraburkholderia phenoliruptrix TaxID=252970 RepID=A0ABV3W882_9BURK|nr:hypothetical protein [Paraburkholderia phenoliruptrix]MDR6391563.1 hypothetical protein [Paraburkholderia phenoliruptrix]